MVWSGFVFLASACVQDASEIPVEGERTANRFASFSPSDPTDDPALDSLRRAIDDANANPGADNIILSSGTWPITLAGAGEDANATGDFDITGPLTIIGDGIGATIIDAGTLDRVFHVAGSADRLTLVNLTIQGGDAGLGDGGCILSEASVWVEEVEIKNCDAENGGAISMPSGTAGALEIYNGSFDNNEANVLGGAIQSGAQGVIANNSSFTNNSAGLQGGAIHVTNHSLDLDYVEFNDNTAFNGGAVELQGPSTVVTLDWTNFTQNIADELGGGLHATGMHIDAYEVQFSDNEARLGGGAALYAASADWVSVDFIGNKATSSGFGNNGGGIWLDSNSSLTGYLFFQYNEAHVGAGLAAVNGSAVHLTNTVAWDNTAVFSGGAFYIQESSLYAYGLRAWRNTATTFNGGALNLIDLDFTVTNLIQNSNIKDNTAGGEGGGIAYATYLPDVLEINETGIDNNSATDGGGVYFEDWSFTSSSSQTLRFVRSSVTLNDASGDGGGIYGNIDDFATLELENTTVSGNTAVGDGGGILVSATSPTTVDLLFSTVADNTANNGAGVLLDGSVTGSTAASLYVNNNATVDGDDCRTVGAATLGTSDYNIFEDACGPLGTGCAGINYGAPGTGDLYGDPLGLCTGTVYTPSIVYLPLYEGDGAPDFTIDRRKAHPLYPPAGNDPVNHVPGAVPMCTAIAVDEWERTRNAWCSGFACDVGAFEYISSTACRP